MIVKFARIRSIGGVDYHPGTHEVPDEFRKHWGMLAWIANGDATILAEPKVMPKANLNLPPTNVVPAEAKPEETPSQAKSRRKREKRAEAAAQKKDRANMDMVGEVHQEPGPVQCATAETNGGGGT